MSRQQNAGHRDMNTANKVSEIVAKFMSLRTALTNQYFIRKEIKSLMNSGSACYRSVQNPLSAFLLSKNMKIKIHTAIILADVI
jgi:hypothetical protein